MDTYDHLAKLGEDRIQGVSIPSVAPIVSQLEADVHRLGLSKADE